MSRDDEFADLPEEWVERMIEFDEKLRLEEAPDGVEIAPEQAGIRRLLLNLQEMHSPAKTPTPPAHPAGLPERIGRYEIRRMLGAGGFAVVYLARDPSLDREVAIKIPLPRGLLNQDARNRFVQEARLTAQLDHPHIVPAYEAGQDGPVPFIAYAYCAGPTLAAWIQGNGRFEPRAAASLLISLADAVAYSHERGILHRDLKPANVLLFPSARSPGFPFVAKLSDFGLAKLMESVASDTASSTILGTPLYMAPEQIESATASSYVTTDVYGLGAILYEILTGKAPSSGASVMQVLESIRNGKIEKVRQLNPQVPQELAIICEKALSLLPRDRYPSAEEFRDDLIRFVNGERIAGRPISQVALAKRALTAPARIGDASGFIILSFAAMGLWMILWPVAGLVGLSVSASAPPKSEIILYTIPLLVNACIGIGFGWQIGQQKKWAAASIAILSGLLCLIVIAVLAQWMPPFYPSVYSDERTREIVYLLLLCLFATQSFLATCAWLALRRKSRVLE